MSDDYDVPPHTVARETRDARYDSAFLGEVVNDPAIEPDPLGLNRVKVLIPGLSEPSTPWALSGMQMLGVGEGFSFRPRKGANVLVWFLQGDVRFPIWFPGNFGSPVGVSDLPARAEKGHPDVWNLTWRQFSFTIDGRAGAEKLTIEDVTTGTLLRLQRATGNFERTVSGSVGDEVATVKRHLSVTLQTGDETRTISLGKRTTTIRGDDAKTLVVGSELTTVGKDRTKNTTGLDSETVGGAKSEVVGGASSEAVTGAKSIVAGGAIALTAGGAVSVVGSGVTVQSLGPSTTISAGLSTRTLLGGILETVLGGVSRLVTGAVVDTVTGLWELVAGGIFKVTGADVRLGLGPHKAVALVDELVSWANAHTHSNGNMGSPTGAPIEQIVPGGVPPAAYDLNKVKAAHLKGS